MTTDDDIVHSSLLMIRKSMWSAVRARPSAQEKLAEASVSCVSLRLCSNLLYQKFVIEINSHAPRTWWLLCNPYAPILTPPAVEGGGLASQKMFLAFWICARPNLSEIWKGHFLLGFRAKARAAKTKTSGSVKIHWCVFLMR